MILAQPFAGIRFGMGDRQHDESCDLYRHGQHPFSQPGEISPEQRPPGLAERFLAALQTALCRQPVSPVSSESLPWLFQNSVLE
jgi:hypothetical protein